MSVKLYGNSSSGNCLKTRWVAELMALPFEWIEVDTFAGQTRTPQFLAINPTGQVPVAILDDGRMLAQSNAIIVHLAEGSTLIPADAYDRAKMFEWMFWEQYSHEPAIAVRIALRHFMKTPEADLDPSLLTKGHAALARMELELNSKQYFVSDMLSLADIALFAYTRNAPLGGFDLGAYPSVNAWISRIAGELLAKGATGVRGDGTAVV